MSRVIQPQARFRPDITATDLTAVSVTVAAMAPLFTGAVAISAARRPRSVPPLQP